MVGWGGAGARSWLRSGALVLLLGAVLLASTPAAAHTTLLGAVPGPGETVPAPVTEVVLRFLDPLASAPEVSVDGPGGPVEVVGTALDDDGLVATTPILIDEPGRYEVAYRFVAADGARQEQAHAFSVVAPDELVGTDWGDSLGPGALVAAVAVAAGVALGVRRRRAAPR